MRVAMKRRLAAGGIELDSYYTLWTCRGVDLDTTLTGCIGHVGDYDEEKSEYSVELLVPSRVAASELCARNSLQHKSHFLDQCHRLNQRKTRAGLGARRDLCRRARTRHASG